MENKSVNRDTELGTKIKNLRLLVKKTAQNNENLILNKLNYIEDINEEIRKQNEKILSKINKGTFWDKLFSLKKTKNKKILKIFGIKISIKDKNS